MIVLWNESVDNISIKWVIIYGRVRVDGDKGLNYISGRLYKNIKKKVSKGSMKI